MVLMTGSHTKHQKHVAIAAPHIIDMNMAHTGRHMIEIGNTDWETTSKY